MSSEQLPNTGFKKKLYKLAPGQTEEVACRIQQTKRRQSRVMISGQSNERQVREMLARKVCGSHMGLWLLVPEHLRLGSWKLLQGLFGRDAHPLSGQLGLQMTNEAAVCLGRLRRKDSLCHQGFCLVGGVSVLASDEAIHQILDQHSMAEYEGIQQALLRVRKQAGHYQDPNPVLALDPHRIGSASQRGMPKKKKRAGEPSKKMLQTFFCTDVLSGQPLGFTLASAGKTCSKGSRDLLGLLERAGIDQGLVLADKEHFTQSLCRYFHQHPGLDMLIPAPGIASVNKRLAQISYRPLWAGYAIGEGEFRYRGSPLTYRLLGQREGEVPGHYRYTGFLSTSGQPAQTLLTHIFDKRWSIEEFFNFEGEMGWNRASTFNLNIRYGKMSLALLAQAASYQLKSKLPRPYRQWSARTLAEKVLTNMEGDIRVRDDKIIVTYYRDHEPLGLQNHYHNISGQLEREGISPKIPWLFDFKLEFRFK